MAEGPVPLRSPVLEGIAHGFFTRTGGVSRAPLAGLQIGLGAGDEPPAVAENRRRAIAALVPSGTLILPFQTHSSEVAVATGPMSGCARARVDALVTDRPGLVIGVLTADCGPVLFADRAAGVIGAAHAGWRGAFGGVLEETLVVMERLGARRDRIAAALGPTIAQSSYEVDDAFRARFLNKDRDSEAFFARGRPGHHQFNLPAYIARRMRNAGVERFDDLARDTFGDERFFSYRRSVRDGLANYGRQLSAIALLPGAG